MENQKEGVAEVCLKMKIKNIFLIIGIILLIGGTIFFLNNGVSVIDDFSSSSVTPLNTRTDMEWETLINSRTFDDATTDCYDHQIEREHHIMYCNKIAGSDTELGFKTLFKSRVKNYKITEIIEIQRSEEYQIIVGEKEVICPKESKNITCWKSIYETKTRYWTETITIPLTTKAISNDYEITSKRDYVKDEKRIYKIEWDDIAPTKTKPQITNLGSGIQRATFPLVQEFYNELSINPNRTWNYTTNNWGGVASGTELDTSYNITAIGTAGTSTEVTQAQTDTLFGDPTAWSYMGTMPGDTSSNVIASKFTSNSTTTIGVITINAKIRDDACGGSGADITIDVIPGAGDPPADLNSSIGTCTIPVGDLSQSWQPVNCTSWDSIPTLTNGNIYWFIIQSSGLCNGLGANLCTPTDYSFYFWTGAWDYKNDRDLPFQLWQNVTGASVYNEIGNRTLDGFCPNYPDIYEAIGSGFSQVDNDVSNYGGLTIKTASDNSTWANEVGFDAIAGTQSACYQMIPNVTTSEAGITPRIYEVWLDYKSLISPSIDLDSPTNTTYYTSSIDLFVSAYDVDGISSLWYSYNTTDNTTIDYPNNVTLDDLSDGSYELLVWVNDTDNNMNTTNVTFYVYPVPTTITPIINSSDVVHNRTDDDIYCIFQPLSNLGGADLTANITWWIDDINNATSNEVEVINGTQYVETLLPAGTQRDDAIKCEVSIFDKIYASEPRNSSTITILNTPPTTPAYDYPINDTSTENATTELRCYGSIDADLDPINYTIMGDTSNPPTTLLQNTTATGYNWTISSIGYHWWRCRADDSTDVSSYNVSRRIYMNNLDIINSTMVYTSSIYETDETYFEINITVNDLLVSNLATTFDYNGTIYAPLKERSNLIHYKFSLSNFTIPLVGLSGGSKIWFWNITPTYLNSTSGKENITNTGTQTVEYIDMGFCNTSLNITFVNFTMIDELTEVEINATAHATSLEAGFKYWLGDGSVYKNYSYQLLANDTTTRYPFCVIPTNRTMKVNMDMDYDAVDYGARTYYFRNAPLTNVTNEINLKLLSEDDYVKFFFEVRKGVDQFPNAIVTISKYDVSEDVYKQVGLRQADGDGKFVEYLELDKQYQFAIVEGGVSYGTINKVAICEEAPCEIILNTEEAAEDMWQGYYATFATDVSYSLVFDSNTNVVTYTFNDLTGLAQYFRLEVNQMEYNQTGKIVCDKSLYVSSGSLICNMTLQGYDSGDFSAKGYISRSPEKIVSSIMFLISSIVKTLGLLGILATLFIIVTVALVGAWNPAVGVVMTVFAVLMMKILEFAAFSWTTVILIVIMGGILAFNMKS